MQCNSVLNVFLVHNKEHEGGNQTLSKQRKYYKENVNISHFKSGCGNYKSKSMFFIDRFKVEFCIYLQYMLMITMFS